MTKEEKNNVTRLSALCSITTIYIQGCKKTIEEANTIAIKRQCNYDNTHVSNKKVIDKKIKEAIKNLHLTLNTTTHVLNRIDKSMRETLSDEFVENLIDKLDEVLENVDLDEDISSSPVQASAPRASVPTPKQDVNFDDDEESLSYFAKLASDD